METIQDKIENEISNIKSGLESSRSDLMRQISDFIMTSSEASQEQSRQIENYATNFASLGMLCLHVESLSSRGLYSDESCRVERRISGGRGECDLMIVLFLQSGVALARERTWRSSW